MPERLLRDNLGQDILKNILDIPKSNFESFSESKICSRE